MAGGSGANTIIPLASLNRAVCLLVYEYMNFNKDSIKICNVMSIRSLIKKNANLTELPKKEQLLPILENLMNIKLPVILKKNGKPAVENEDIADAVAVGLYTIYHLKDLEERIQELHDKNKAVLLLADKHNVKFSSVNKKIELAQTEYKLITGKNYEVKY